MKSENLPVSGDLCQTILEDALIHYTKIGGLLRDIALIVSESNRDEAFKITEGTSIKVRIVPEMPPDDWFIVGKHGLVYSGV